MRNTSKMTTLENKFPLLAVEHGCIISKDADITVAFEDVYKRQVHLRVDGGGHVLPVDGDRLPLLQLRRLRYLAELVVRHNDTIVVVVLDVVEETHAVGGRKVFLRSVPVSYTHLSSVNLTAFDSRLFPICIIRSLSVNTMASCPVFTDKDLSLIHIYPLRGQQSRPSEHLRGGSRSV